MMTYGRSRITVPFDRCTVAIRYPDGSRTLITRRRLLRAASRRRTGRTERTPWSRSTLRSPPTAWSRWSPSSPSEVASVDAAAATLKRRWTVSEELELLPARLEPDESVVLDERGRPRDAAGLLVVTTA